MVFTFKRKFLEDFEGEMKKGLSLARIIFSVRRLKKIKTQFMQLSY
jgi:hypothetical protein